MVVALKEYIDLIPKQLRGIHIEFTEGGTGDWEVHKGDLIVNGDWPYKTHGLIVDGNVHIHGVYDGCTHLVVMGDMFADHIIYWWGLTVVGNLTVPGMINMEHYLYPFEVGGTIQTRSLTIQHDQRQVNWSNLIAKSISAGDLGHDTRAILRDIKPALLAEPFQENAYESLDEMSLAPNYEASLKCVSNGESPFREEPLAEEIIEKIDSYLASMNSDEEMEYDDAELEADMRLDPMLALTIAVCVEECDLIRDCLKNIMGQHGAAFDEVLENLL